MRNWLNVDSTYMVEFWSTTLRSWEKDNRMPHALGWAWWGEAGSEQASGRMVWERFCHSSFHQYGSYSFDWKLSWLDYRSFSRSLLLLLPDSWLSGSFMTPLSPEGIKSGLSGQSYLSRSNRTISPIVLCSPRSISCVKPPERLRFIEFTYSGEGRP
jgi:hypothetical protein